MMAPVVHELRKRQIPHFVVHTGQHYSPAMDSESFEDLRLGAADHYIENPHNVTTHAEQTARMMVGCESIFQEELPGLVLVNGDANTNLAAALAARKLGISVAQSEAGERSYDWAMPEEHNRRIIDHILDLLFPTGAEAKLTLSKENCQEKVVVTGNTIVDASLFSFTASKLSSSVLELHGLSSEDYIVVTAHREENVDYRDKLKTILLASERAHEITGLDVIFPMHPRAKKMVSQFGLTEALNGLGGVQFIDPLRYLEFT